MRGDGADENSGGHPAGRGQSAEGGSQRKVNHVKSEMSDRAPLNSTIRERSPGKRRRKSTQLLLREVSSTMQCVAKIMAMLGTRTTVADLCMFGLVACDEGGPGFARASVRTVTNARQVGMDAK